MRNPGGGNPPLNFTQGGVMVCHPPPETALGFFASVTLNYIRRL